MSPFVVHKCVCHNIEFVDIKEYVNEHNIDSATELKAAGVCSTKCQMCEPYVEILIRTGEVEFEPGAYIGRKQTS